MEKSGILAQSSGAMDRLIQHRWSIGLAALGVSFFMAAALAIAPTPIETVSLQTVVEQLALKPQPLTLGDTSLLREERVQRGDTVGSILTRLGIASADTISFIQNSPETRVMHQQMAPGKIVRARTSEYGELGAIYFPLNGRDTALVVERAGNQHSAREVHLRFETITLLKSGEIRSSLFAATDAAGIPDSIATQLAEIFSGEIDFHRDLRKEDRFSVVYEMQYLSGQPAHPGNILAAEFINSGKIHRAIRFEQNGKSAYYTPEGKSLRKAFLKSPLEFSRVTSGFSMRFHPILQQWRAHKGIDYGAPSGTPVRATGDGTVEFSGHQSGYGNLVIVKHPGNYSTAYGHLQSFSRGIRRGIRVNQGDTIGYVGQTGWATGPHLHYEFRINNQQVNPLSVNLPTSAPLDVAQLARFKNHAPLLADKLDILRSANLSALE